MRTCSVCACARLCEQGVATSGAFKRRTLKVHAVREVDMLPNLLFALSHTTPALAHDGLEMLSMMVCFIHHARQHRSSARSSVRGLTLTPVCSCSCFFGSAIDS